MKKKSPILVLMNNKVLVLVLLIGLALSFMSEYFLTVTNIVNLIRQVCGSVVVSLGLTMVIASGNIDLSIGSIIGIVGILSAMIANKGVPFIVVLASAIVIGALLGILNAEIVNIFRINSFITTLAMASVYEGTVYLITNNRSITKIPEAYVFVGQGKCFGIPLPIIIMVFVIIVIYILMNKTVFGRRILAVGGNRDAAKVCGTSIEKTTRSAFMGAGICAGVAALIITGRAASAQITAGSGMEMDAIAAAVIGGTSMAGGNANVLGTVFGCLLVGLIANGLNLLGVNSNWQTVVKGLLILIAVILDVQSTILIERVSVKKK